MSSPKDLGRAVRRPAPSFLVGLWGVVGAMLLVGVANAETLYSPFSPEETAQRITQVFSRYGLQARRQDDARPVGSGKQQILHVRVESPVRVMDASRCRWADAYGRPIEVEVRGEGDVTEVSYRLPPKRVNAFGVIECGKTHDDLTQAMRGLMELALSGAR